MKIAIASDNKNVASHFGHCEAFECFTVKDKKIQEWSTIPNPGHKPGFLSVFLYKKEVNVIISGGMGQSTAELFQRNGIEVICGAIGNIEDNAKSYINGTLNPKGPLCEEHDY